MRGGAKPVMLVVDVAMDGAAIPSSRVGPQPAQPDIVVRRHELDVGITAGFRW